MISVKKTKGSYVSPDRHWMKQMSKWLVDVLSSLLNAVNLVEMSLGGSCPKMTTIFHSWMDNCLVKIQNTLIGR